MNSSTEIADRIWVGLLPDAPLGKIAKALATGGSSTDAMAELTGHGVTAYGKAWARDATKLLAVGTGTTPRTRGGRMQAPGIGHWVRAEQPVVVHAQAAMATPTAAAASAIVQGQQGSPQGKPPAPGTDGVQFPAAPPSPTHLRNFVTPTWYDSMIYMLDAKRHISIAGPPGVGKSTAIEQLAAERGIPLVTINADAGLRKRDLVGSVELQNGTTRFDMAEYAAAAINGWWCVINEVNAADADALLFLNSQLAPPYMVNVHGRQFKVHPNFRLVITYNPGLIGTKPLPQAFKDRFFPIKIGFPEAPALRRMLEANGMPRAAVYGDALINFAMATWKAHEDGKIRYQISPRRLFDAVTLLEGRRTTSVRRALKESVVNTIDSSLDTIEVERIAAAAPN